MNLFFEEKLNKLQPLSNNPTNTAHTHLMHCVSSPLAICLRAIRLTLVGYV